MLSESAMLSCCRARADCGRSIQTPPLAGESTSSAHKLSPLRAFASAPLSQVRYMPHAPDRLGITHTHTHTHAAKSPSDQIGRLALAAIDACLQFNRPIIAADGCARPPRRDVLSLCIDRDLGPRLLVNMDVLVWLRDGGMNVCVVRLPCN